jgi:hypothetical protein
LSILEFTLAAMTLLAPDRSEHDHEALGGAIAAVVDAAPPLFAGDESRRKTAALIVAVAFREGSFRPDVVGDHGRSFCTMQIHASSGGSPALLTDPVACIAKGLAMLRTSMRECPAAPVAWYASGPRGCENARAQRISRDRIALAQWLVRSVAP